VWLAESTIHLCARCEGEWDASSRADAEILNGRWEVSPVHQARWGRQAYCFRKLRILGAFVDDSGAEFIPEHKKRRAYDLSSTGWA